MGEHSYCNINGTSNGSIPILFIHNKDDWNYEFNHAVKLYEMMKQNVCLNSMKECINVLEPLWCDDVFPGACAHCADQFKLYLLMMVEVMLTLFHENLFITL